MAVERERPYMNVDLIQKSVIKWSQLYHAYRCNEKCLAILAHADHLHVSSAVQSNVVRMAVLIRTHDPCLLPQSCAKMV